MRHPGAKPSRGGSRVARRLTLRPEAHALRGSRVAEELTRRAGAHALPGGSRIALGLNRRPRADGCARGLTWRPLRDEDGQGAETVLVDGYQGDEGAVWGECGDGGSWGWFAGGKGAR
jgi:hypothetical protein